MAFVLEYVSVRFLQRGNGVVANKAGRAWLVAFVVVKLMLG